MLRKAVVALTLSAVCAASSAPPVSVRVYPAAESTRLILESSAPLSYTPQTLTDPPRLVYDVEANATVEALAAINASDTSQIPYISVLRAGHNRPGRMRIVFELADEVEHNAFALEPVGQYSHRLMIDVMPKTPPDPLLDLLRELGGGESGGTALAPAPALPEEDYIEQLLLSLQPFIVVIDPGHGGDDPGAVAASGMREKDVVLDIALRLKRALDGVPGVNALLTRTDDYFIALGARVRKAHRYKADLFVSVHADAFGDPRPMGTSVFVLSRRGASSKFARKLADQENLSDLIGGIDSNFVARDAAEEDLLKAMSFDGKQHASKLLAHQVRAHLGDVAHQHGDSIESAGFAVLKSPSIPSVLVETGFLSNPEEARLLGQDGYRQKMADTIARAIVDYYEQYHRATARAQ